MKERFFELFTLHGLSHLLEHAVLDSLKLLPFLFLSYLVMEFVEHRAKERTLGMISSCKGFAPAAGAALGLLPQCGFGAAVAGLYSGGLVTAGTLVAVFLSTGDEMLPVMISNSVPASAIGITLAVKFVAALLFGFALDFALKLLKKDRGHSTVEELCKHEGCNCHSRGVLRSALKHTFQVFLFIFVFNLVMGAAIEIVSEDFIAGFFSSVPWLAYPISSLVGLIPNCASSVLITSLALEGSISFGAMISGLLSGSGVGLLVLFKTNRSLKQNFGVLAYLIVVGIICGAFVDLSGLKI